MDLILASTSRYRQTLLQKLGLDFTIRAPDVDETARPNETAAELSERLAVAKALAVSDLHKDAVIIGSDQVASLNNKLLGKPGDHANAVKQLQECSGKEVTFYTGLCVHNCATQQTLSLVESFVVSFRKLNNEQIQAYLIKEQPYDCAGSFKSEGLGICLFEKLSGRDPNTLIGLPMIALYDLLLKQGVDALVVENQPKPDEH